MIPLPLLFPSVPMPLELPACQASAFEVALTGDLMMHQSQLASASQLDGSIDFMGTLDGVSDVLQSATVTAGNLETPVGAPDVVFNDEYLGFNAPHEYLLPIRAAGFDVLQTMNNHTLDRYGDGVDSTLDAVWSQQMRTVGTYRTALDRDEGWALVQVDGARVGFLAYGEMDPAAADAELNARINMVEPKSRLLDDVRRARAHADVLIVGVHWGEEYELVERERQRSLARQIIEAGADVVWGTHPHVLQPAEVLTVPSEFGSRDGLVLYSLGNFISGQTSFPRDGGVIVRLDAAACGGRGWLTGVRFAPTWVDRTDRLGRLSYRVLLTSESDAGCRDNDMTDADCKRMHSLHDQAARQLPSAQFDSEPGQPAWEPPFRIGSLSWPWMQL